MLTTAQAREEIKTHLWVEWEDGLENGYTYLNQVSCEEVTVDPAVFKVNGSGEVYTPELKFENDISYDRLDQGKHLVRFSDRSTGTEDLDHRSLESVRRMRNRGLIIVDVYYSITAYTQEDADFIEPLLQNIFRRKQTNSAMVKFWNSRIISQAPIVNYFHTTIFADYRFDELVR